MKLSLMIAQRYYKAAYQNRYIRFINQASTIGISIGVMALILALSIMNGFERELKNSLLAVIPDVEYEAVEGKIHNWKKSYEYLSQQSEVKGAAPYIKLNAMVQKQNQLQASILHGVNPELEKSVNAVIRFIVKGAWLESTNDAVIGAGLAATLDLSVGDKLELLIPKTLANGKLAAPQYVKLTITGIYQLGGQMDHGQVYMDITKLQKVLGWGQSEVEGIKVSLFDPFSARYVGKRIGRELDEYVFVLDWFRTNGHIYNDIVMVKDIMYLAMILVMAVACFNIVSSLTMAVQEKHSDIGILKTMGLKAKVIRQVFTLMGMLTAVKGVIWGLVIGVLLALNLETLIQALEQLFGFKTLDAQVYFISHIPSQLHFGQVGLICITALVIAFIASFVPAQKAAKLLPIELVGK